MSRYSNARPSICSAVRDTNAPVVAGATSPDHGLVTKTKRWRVDDAVDGKGTVSDQGHASSVKGDTTHEVRSAIYRIDQPMESLLELLTAALLSDDWKWCVLLKAAAKEILDLAIRVGVSLRVILIGTIGVVRWRNRVLCSIEQ